MNDRTSLLRTETLSIPPSISAERAELLTEFYRENEGKHSVPMMRALAFQYLCERKTLHLGKGELIGKARAFEERFSDGPYWRDRVSKCISCGICTYVCPTCYCFTIADEIEDLQGERLRAWDSCMFYQYTLEASGHNPRPSKFERYRNRIGHKFSYFPDQYNGMISCCGCGRCIRSCPVSIDIRRIVGHL